jgi:hypothetical protein
MATREPESTEPKKKKKKKNRMGSRSNALQLNIISLYLRGDLRGIKSTQVTKLVVVDLVLQKP